MPIGQNKTVSDEVPWNRLSNVYWSVNTYRDDSNKLYANIADFIVFAFVDSIDDLTDEVRNGQVCR